MSYTVNISLPKKLAQATKEQVQSGYYASVSELVRDALRKLILSPAVPTYPMSKQAEQRAIRARNEHLAGNTLEIKSLSDIEKKDDNL
jgi:putative addiction module CopG family antidote